MLSHSIDTKWMWNMILTCQIQMSYFALKQAFKKVMQSYWDISGMYSFRNDAVKRGTQRPPYGIAIYYKPHLIQQPPTIANMNGVEILVCPVKRGSDNSIKVMAVYKPPVVPLHCLLNSLYSAIRNHCGDGQLIIMGDFNVGIYGSTSDKNNWKSSCQELVFNSISKKLQQTCGQQLTIYIVMWKI